MTKLEPNSAPVPSMPHVELEKRPVGLDEIAQGPASLSENVAAGAVTVTDVPAVYGPTPSVIVG
jgi:hypothetical protein